MQIEHAVDRFRLDQPQEFEDVVVNIEADLIAEADENRAVTRIIEADDRALRRAHHGEYTGNNE